MRNANIVKSDRGQTIIIYALVVPILILFAGFAIDAGILYVTKAKLSTAVDGATLTGMKNLQSGQSRQLRQWPPICLPPITAPVRPRPPYLPDGSYGDQQVQVTAQLTSTPFSCGTSRIGEPCR